MPAAVIFPGQGSQAPQMGLPWRHHPVWELVERAEEVLGRRLEPFLTSADEVPTATRDVQVSVFLVSVMAWEAIRPVLGLPLVFAGHSLGQVSALAAAGVVSFDDAVRLVAYRGEVTDEACREQAGGMFAALAMANDRASWACSAAPGECWLANDNAPGQVVLAGTRSGLRRVEARARQLGARKIIPLAVQGPFHTPLMLGAAERFGDYLRSVAFSAPSRPIVSNADARLVGTGPVWATLLADHLIHPVRWVASQHRLAGLGVDLLVEAGFGTTLTSIAERTVPGMAAVNVDGPAALEALAEAVASRGGAGDESLGGVAGPAGALDARVPVGA